MNNTAGTDKQRRLIRVELTDEELRALKIEAVRRDTTLQALITELLRQRIAEWEA